MCGNGAKFVLVHTHRYKYDWLKMEKVRAPRNRTLVVADDEKADLMCETIALNAEAELDEVMDRVIFQDLLDCVRHLPENSIDLAILDPPYNLDKMFGQTKFKSSSASSYAVLFQEWVSGLKRCLKPSATIYVCADWKTSSIIYPVLEKNFKVRNRITWEREKGRGANSNWKNCSEDIWFCTMSDEYFFDVESVKLKKRVIAPYKDNDGSPKDWSQTEDGNFRLTHPSNLWTDISIPFWSMPENTDHPTQKPEKLIAKLILASSKVGDVILDPFLGSGTTAVVANKLNRHFVGIEREEYYCQLAVKRLRQARHDNSIQGYTEGFFWERNSLAQQQQSGVKSRKSLRLAEIGNLFAEN